MSLFVRYALIVTVILGLTTSCTVQPIQPAPVAAEGAPASGLSAPELITQLADVASQGPIVGDRLNQYLAHFAKDATFTEMGTSCLRRTFIGDRALAAYFHSLEDEERGPRTFEILNVEGDRVVARCSMTTPDGVTMQGLEIFEVRDGLITSDTHVASPATIERIVAAAAERGEDLRQFDRRARELNVVTALMAPAAEGMSPESIDEMLGHYSDTAIFTLLGLPGGPQVLQGHDAIRATLTQWMEGGQRAEYEPLMTAYAAVLGRTRISSNDLDALGIDYLEGTSIHQVARGLVQREYWIIDPDSLEKLLNAFAAMQAEAQAAVEADARATVEQWAAALAQAPQTASTLQELYADGALLRVLASMDAQRVHEGSDDIAAWHAAHVQSPSVEILHVLGGTVVARINATDPIYGDAEVDQLEVFVVEDGRIVEEIVAVTPSTLEQQMAAAVAAGAELPPQGDAEGRLDVIANMQAPWVGEAIAADAAQKSLAAYADGAVFTIYGLPWGIEVFPGMEALQPLFDGWQAQHQRWEFEPIMVVGDFVVGRTHTWLDDTVALGLAPVEALEVFEVRDGRIQSDTWTVTPESLVRILEALAAMPAE